MVNLLGPERPIKPSAAQETVAEKLTEEDKSE